MVAELADKGKLGSRLVFFFFFILDCFACFTCLLFINFHSSIQVKGLIEAKGRKGSSQAFLQIEEDPQVASLDLLTQTVIANFLLLLSRNFRHESVVPADQTGFAKKIRRNAVSAAPRSTSPHWDGTSFSHQGPSTSSSARFVCPQRMRYLPSICSPFMS